MADDKIEHIGRGLRARREALGLTRRDMANHNAFINQTGLRFIENAPAASLWRVRHYDEVLRALAADTPAWLAMPYARREQWYDTVLDARLWQQAMADRPRVIWWWGTSRSRGALGAWCHLCDELVHPYDAGRPMTHRARTAIMAHRTVHPVAGVLLPAPVPEVEPA